MKGAIANPILFRDKNSFPDYISTFPNTYNVTQRNYNIWGMGICSNWIRRHIGILYLQFVSEIGDNMALNVYKYSIELNTFEAIDPNSEVDISPVGWTGNRIYKHTLDLDDGFYYLEFSNGYQSDVFEITSSASDELIKIQYSNSINKFGCIFGVNYFTAYFLGQLKEDSPFTEIDGWQSDEGVFTKTRSASTGTALLVLPNIHYTYKKVISKIFEMNTLIINGVSYQNKEGASWEETGGDTGKMQIKLFENSSNQYLI